MVALNFLQALASLYIMAEVVMALNRMSGRTAHAIRVAYVLLAGGALTALASARATPNLIECILVLAVAFYLGVDRRKHRKARHGH